MTFEDLQAYYASLSPLAKFNFSAALNGYVSGVRSGMPGAFRDAYVSEDARRRVMLIAPEYKRLDAFARLIVGDQVCAAVAIKDDQLIIATNECSHPEGSLVRDNVTKLCNYIKRDAPTQFINEYTTETSNQLISELLKPAMAKEFDSLKSYCENLIAKNQRAGQQAHFKPCFWEVIREKSNRLFADLMVDLSAGLYEHLSGKERWSKEGDEPNVIGDVYDDFGIKAKADQKEPKVNGQYIDSFLDQEAFLMLMMDSIELPDRVSFVAGKGDVPKKINIFIKKCVVQFVRSYTDLLLLMDYVQDDKAPLNAVLDAPVSSKNIHFVEGLAGEKGVHAEMRLLEFVKKQGWLPLINYVGLGKLCCPNCHLVLKTTAQYLDTESEFKELAEGLEDEAGTETNIGVVAGAGAGTSTSKKDLARGHHSNIPHWPITDYHRHDTGFLTAIFGDGYPNFIYLKPDEQRHLFRAVEYFYNYMNDREDFSSIGVESDLKRISASSLTPMSLSSVAGLLPLFGLEYYVCRIDPDMYSTTDCHMFWNEHQLLCLPYWNRKPLIKGLKKYEKLPWANSGSPFVADKGGIAKSQHELYVMLCFSDHLFDSDEVKRLFKEELDLYRSQEPATIHEGALLYDEIMSALKEEKISGNEIIRMLYQQNDKLTNIYDLLEMGRFGRGDNPFSKIDEFQVWLTLRGKTTVYDAMQRLGVDKEINAQLMSLDKQLRTPLDEITEVKEDEPDSTSTGTPFSDQSELDSDEEDYDSRGYGIKML